MVEAVAVAIKERKAQAIQDVGTCALHTVTMHCCQLPVTAYTHKQKTMYDQLVHWTHIKSASDAVGNRHASKRAYLSVSSLHTELRRIAAFCTGKPARSPLNTFLLCVLEHQEILAVQVKTLIAKHKRLLDGNAMGKMKLEFEEQVGQQQVDIQKDAVKVSLITTPDVKKAFTTAEITAIKRAKVGLALHKPYHTSVCLIMLPCSLFLVA